MTTRTVISTSKKKIATNKAGWKTLSEMVVYKTRLSNGKIESVTKHEPKS